MTQYHIYHDTIYDWWYISNLALIWNYIPPHNIHSSNDTVGGCEILHHRFRMVEIPTKEWMISNHPQYFPYFWQYFEGRSPEKYIDFLSGWWFGTWILYFQDLIGWSWMWWKLSRVLVSQCIAFSVRPFPWLFAGVPPAITDFDEYMAMLSSYDEMTRKSTPQRTLRDSECQTNSLTPKRLALLRHPGAEVSFAVGL